MPELSDALHELYEEEARSFTTPPRGLNVLTAQARGARRRSVLKASALSAVGVAAVGGLVAGSLQLFGGAQPIAPATQASVTPDAAPLVLWDPWSAVDEATAGFTLPQCGDPFAPDPVDVAGILPAPAAVVEGDGDGNAMGIWVADGYTATDDAPGEFLAIQASFVFTQDGVVVGTSTFEAGNLDLYRKGLSPSSGTLLMGLSHCETRAQWETEFAEAYDNYAELDPAAQAELDARNAEFHETRAGLPHGEYLVYQVTPIIFGEHLAVAKQVKAMGVRSLGQVYSDPGSTVLAKDPLIAAYCVPGEDNGFGGTPDPACTPPLDVLQMLLTFTVREDSVVDVPSGVAVSAPVRVTFP